MVKTKFYDEKNFVEYRHNAITIWSKTYKQYFLTEEENAEVLSTTYEINLTEYSEEKHQVAEWTVFCELCNKAISEFSLNEYGTPIGKINLEVENHYKLKHNGLITK